MAYTIESLPVGESVTIKALYTVEDSATGNDNFVNTVTVTGDGVDDSGSSKGVAIDAIVYDLGLQTVITNDGKGSGMDDKFTEGDVIKYQITATNDGNVDLNNIEFSSNLQGFEFKLIPQTEQEFQAMTWDEIKTIADMCATSDDTSDYKHMLGWSKPGTITGYGDVNYQIVALNNGNKVGGGKAGFTFLLKEGIVATKMTTAAGTKTIWETCLVRPLLNDTVFEGLEDGLKQAISEIEVEGLSNSIASPNATTPTIKTKDKLWLASSYEVLNNDTMGTEGTPFDWFVSNPASERVRKLIGASTAAMWWLRTPIYNQSQYKFRDIQADGSIDTTVGTNSNGVVVPAFCI